MKQNILIIGRSGFLATNLFKYFKSKKISVVKISFNFFLKNQEKKLLKYNYVINCSINSSFLNKKYDSKYDQDLLCAEKLKDVKSKLIIFSTGKVYGPGSSLKETSKKKPIERYGKNKSITEINLFKTKKDLLIFRLSNIVGKENKNNSRKVTNLFFDDIRKNLKKNLVVVPKKNYYKDFVLIEDFVKIIYLSIIKDLKGIFNLSTNTKIYLHDLAKDISSFTGAKLIYSNSITYSFTLNNKKLLDKITINKFKDLRKYFYKFI